MRAAILAVLLLLAVPATAPAIVGGKTTTTAWPHMAAMEYREPEDTEHRFRCGASLIRPDVLLTAAHCVDDADSGATLPAARFRFLVGTLTRSSGGERLAATDIVEHPRYDQSGGGAGDLALVRLERPAALGGVIRVAGPADASRWEPGDPARVIGWGATTNAGEPTDALKEAQVPIVSDPDCAFSYRFTLGFDPATSVCAGPLLGGNDSCQGDSGGPLMVTDAAGRWVQIGVVSYGLGCATPTQYGVYAEAAGAALRPWVDATASSLSRAAAGGGGGAGGGAGGGTGTAGGGAGGTVTGPPLPSGTTESRQPARLGLPARLGSARRANRRGRLVATLRVPRALRRVTVTLRRGRTVVAIAKRKRLAPGRRRVALRVRRRLRAGTLVLRVTARDATGARVRASRRVRVRR